MTKPSDGWDRPAIVAEVHRRGMTLTGIAKDAGLYANACRQGIIGNSRPGAQAIADALHIPFEELFPASYTRGRHHKSQTIRNESRDTSPKRVIATDNARRVG